MLAGRADYDVKMMARVLGAGRSGFHGWPRPDPDGADPWAALREAILEVWEGSRRRFGLGKVHARLATDFPEFGSVTRYRVRKCMSGLGIRGKCPNASRTTTVPDEGAPARPGLVRRDFESPVPTYKLVGDTACLRTTSGFIYLATAVDLCTRMVVGRGVADNTGASLVVSAMEMAWGRGYVAGNAIFHSDYAAESAKSQFTMTMLVGALNVPPFAA